ncbi:hypothetical protein KY284_022679 [Solanum tuberosum]|nr:hypothetical protein KY284_022679 [Solanum tuberosum]
MDAEVKIEPKEDSNSLNEAIFQSEVEILENIGAERSIRSSGKTLGGDYPPAQQMDMANPFYHSIKLDATIIDSWYRKEVLNLLMTPYNEEEYKKLWKDIRRRLPSRSRIGRGKSLLSLHKGVN